MHNCPYCSRPLLRHIQHHEICWFCSHCWATMPVLSETLTQQSLIANSIGELKQ